MRGGSRRNLSTSVAVRRTARGLGDGIIVMRRSKLTKNPPPSQQSTSEKLPSLVTMITSKTKM